MLVPFQCNLVTFEEALLGDHCVQVGSIEDFCSGWLALSDVSCFIEDDGSADIPCVLEHIRQLIEVCQEIARSLTRLPLEACSRPSQGHHSRRSALHSSRLEHSISHRTCIEDSTLLETSERMSRWYRARRSPLVH